MEQVGARVELDGIPQPRPGAERASTAPVLPHQAPGVSPGMGIMGLTRTYAAVWSGPTSRGAVKAPRDAATIGRATKPERAASGPRQVRQADPQHACRQRGWAERSTGSSARQAEDSADTHRAKGAVLAGCQVPAPEPDRSCQLHPWSAERGPASRRLLQAASTAAVTSRTTTSRRDQAPQASVPRRTSRPVTFGPASRSYSDDERSSVGAP